MVTLQSTLDLPNLLNRESTAKEWMDDPRGKAIFEPIFKNMMVEMRKVLGGSEHTSDTMGMDVMGMMMDMPVMSIFYFNPESLEQSPEEVVDGMLAQVHGK